MADEPDNLVLSILRQIRATQDEQLATLRRHTEEFRKVHDEIADLKQTTVTAGGLSVHANVKADRLESKIVELEQRLERLEEKV